MCLPSDASRNTYRLTWVSLTLGVGYLFMAAPAKCSRCSLPWTRGYLLTAALPDLHRGIAPLGPPAPAQPPLLGCGVGPPGCLPWPRAWGCGGVGLVPVAAAPDLGRAVTPLGRRPSVMGSSRLLPLTSDVG